MGLISQIKADVAKSGANRAKILYVRSDNKVRVRFLQELDDGYSFVFHDNFNEGVNCFCPKNFDEDNDCIYCDGEADVQVRTRNLYAWSVYNYDTKQVEVALFAVNQCTPVNQLIMMSETFGTIMDRDYVLAKSGKQQTTTYAVIPQDKEKFRNPKAKPMSQEAVAKILSEAFPYEQAADKPSKSVVEEKLPKAKKFAKMEDEEIPFDVDEEEAPKKKAKAGISEEFIEDTLEENDIDEDDFMEYHELKSLKKLKDKSKSEFKAMVKEYLEALEEDDDEDDEDEEEDQ